jgi:hypothetical protein
VPSPYYPAADVVLTIRWEEKALGSARPDTTITVRPKRLVVENNGIRTADTIRVTIDAREFPFDPRTFRSIEVVAHLGQRQPGQPFKPTVKDSVFVGFIDTFSRSQGGSGEEIDLEGRDYTGLFLDTPFPYHYIQSGEGLVGWLKRMMAEIPAAANIELVVDTAIDDIIVGGKTDAQIRQNHGPMGMAGGSGGQMYVNDKGRLTEAPRAVQTGVLNHQVSQTGGPVHYTNNYWDAFQEMVDPVGLIIFVQQGKLVLSHPRTLSTEPQAEKAPLFKWGENVESLKINKRVGRLKSPNILVTSYVPGQKEAISATWPEGNDLKLSTVNPPPHGMTGAANAPATPTGAPVAGQGGGDMMLLHESAKLLPF